MKRSAAYGSVFAASRTGQQHAPVFRGGRISRVKEFLRDTIAAFAIMLWDRRMPFFRIKRAAQLARRVINETPWCAVYFDLGGGPDARLVREAHFWAEYCYEAARSRAENPEWRGSRAFEPKPTECGRSASARQHADAALQRLEALEAINPSLKRRCHA